MDTAVFGIKQILAGVALAVILAAAVCLAAYNVRMYEIRKKYGCGACGYKRRILFGRKTKLVCTASCGNNDGKVCPAWRCKRDDE